MENKLNVSSNPHIRSSAKTWKIMLTVFVALLPAAGFGVYLFGPYALLLLIISTLTAVITEVIGCIILKKKISITDCSALVTGLLLGLNLPPGAPWWMAVIGSIFAIFVVKLLFGGLGQNIMNPALAGRCFLVISFAKYMTDFSVHTGWGYLPDGMTGATPLSMLKNGQGADVHRMVLGLHGGCIGETSVIAICIGAIIMLMFGVIELHIPAAYIISFAIFYIIFGGHGADPYYLTGQLAGGGLMLGAFFMATDYVTSPVTKPGRIVYGILLGILTGVFRVFGSTAEGVSYAIIISNLMVPLIDKGIHELQKKYPDMVF